MHFECASSFVNSKFDHDDNEVIIVMKSTKNKVTEMIQPMLPRPKPSIQPLGKQNKGSSITENPQSKPSTHQITVEKDQEVPRGGLSSIPMKACILLRAAREQSTASESDLLACGMTAEELTMLEETQND